MALVAAAYFSAARLGYAFAIPSGAVTLWPPSGVMLGLLLLNPLRNWPAILAGGFAGSSASDLLSGYTPALAALAATANILESYVAARLLSAWIGLPFTLSSVRAVLALTLGAVVGSNAVTALLGASVLVLGFGMPPAFSWFVWWVGDGLGMLLVAPLLLTWRALPRWPRAAATRRGVEAAFLLAALVAVSIWALGAPDESDFHAGPYVVFPFLFWAAARFGPPGAATATMIVAAISTWFTALDRGPFVGHDTSTVLQVYAFLAVTSLWSLIAAAALYERREAIQQARHSEARYRDVVEAATDAIVRIDHHRRIQFANSATTAIFGHAADRLIGRDLAALIPEPFQRPSGEDLQRQEAVVLTGRHEDGREIPLEVSLGESWVDGRQEFTGILRDISQKRAAEQTMRALEDRYRQAQKMEAVGRLAGGIAHDFNNILTVIQGSCDLLASAIDPVSRAGEDVEEIRQAARRAAALTHQLLAFSRRQTLAPRVIQLKDTVGAIEPMLKRLIGAEVSVVTEVSSAGPVLADPGQMEQVIVNLAINARDAMPEGGTLRIGVDDVELGEPEAASLDLTPGSYVRLHVSDTGVGMDAATLAQIFEPFFTTKPIGQGTGLGLATVHGIVKQSKGGIEARSTAGSGSTFAIYLPRVTLAP